MTLEEMIKLCQECVDDWVDPACAEDVKTMRSIITALRAGQAMRDAHQRQFEWALQYGEARLTCCEDAAQAWDAATKGDDK